ncbi:GyrI-like domain-containing protein [Pseudolactococcus yaeyamensis]
MAIPKIDFKKDPQAGYQAKIKPAIIDLPASQFIMVDGKGNPNTSVAYQQAVELLYALSYAIKMSPKRNDIPAGYFDYVVAPLEGLWWLENDEKPTDKITDKAQFNWTAMVRQPDFVTAEVFERALSVVRQKKPDLDSSKARLATFSEGLCHIGSYDNEPDAIKCLDEFIKSSDYTVDISNIRRHHEIYLNDPRRTAPEKLKTIIRHPIK